MLRLCDLARWLNGLRSSGLALVYGRPGPRSVSLDHSADEKFLQEVSDLDCTARNARKGFT